MELLSKLSTIITVSCGVDKDRPALGKSMDFIYGETRLLAPEAG